MDKLDTVFEQIPQERGRRSEQKKALEQLFEENRDKIVIYGHGNLGCDLAKDLEKKGWPVRCFIDANQATNVDKTVVNLEDAKTYVPSDALILITMYDILEAEQKIKSDLEMRGFHQIFSVLDLKAFPEFFPFSTLNWDIGQMDVLQIKQAYALMEDEKSKERFVDLFRLSIEDARISLTCDPVMDQYMPTDVYKPIQNERIVDCGAFDGDTMRSFAKELGSWTSYTAVEPDPQNGARLEESIKSDLPVALRERSRVIHKGVSSENSTVSFFNAGTTYSHVTKNEEKSDRMTTVDIARLDDLIQDEVTLIKMDVEGFEMQALRGGEKLIRANQPLMAICGYHRQTDFWEIPLYLKELLPNHRIFLRNYVGIIEYVFYAVPEDRLLSH